MLKMIEKSFRFLFERLFEYIYEFRSLFNVKIPLEMVP